MREHRPQPHSLPGAATLTGAHSAAYPSPILRLTQCCGLPIPIAKPNSVQTRAQCLTSVYHVVARRRRRGRAVHGTTSRWALRRAVGGRRLPGRRRAAVSRGRRSRWVLHASFPFETAKGTSACDSLMHASRWASWRAGGRAAAGDAQMSNGGSGRMATTHCLPKSHQLQPGELCVPVDSW